MSFVADLRDAIHGFRFADRRLSQLPTPKAASSSNFRPLSLRAWDRPGILLEESLMKPQRQDDRWGIANLISAKYFDATIK